MAKEVRVFCVNLKCTVALILLCISWYLCSSCRRAATDLPSTKTVVSDTGVVLEAVGALSAAALYAIGEGQIMSYDIDGTLLWKQNLDKQIASFAVDTEDNSIIVGTFDGQLVRAGENGLSILFEGLEPNTWDLNEVSPIATNPKERVFGFDNKLWRFRDGKPSTVRDFTKPFPFLRRVHVSRGICYVGTGDGQFGFSDEDWLYAIDLRTNNVLWSKKTNDVGFISKPTDDKLVVSTFGKLMLLEASSGRELNKLRLNGMSFPEEAIMNTDKDCLIYYGNRTPIGGVDVKSWTHIDVGINDEVSGLALFPAGKIRFTTASSPRVIQGFIASKDSVLFTR